MSTVESSASVSLSQIITQTTRAKAITGQKVRDIRQVTAKLRILALNALIEAKHAGEKGAGFSVVADEVRSISNEVETLAVDLGTEIHALDDLTQQLADTSRGTRLVDLALNAVEIIDRNLYERTCDVRWWATDSAIVDLATSPTPDLVGQASKRLGVILDSYTVYIDLWLCSPEGVVLANGRPDRHRITGASVSDRSWFRSAMTLKDGSDFSVADIKVEPLLSGSQVSTYATAVRRNGAADGEIVGVLGIHFDWEPQARGVVDGVRLNGDERDRTRVLLVDGKGLIIAASDGRGTLSQRITLPVGKTSGTVIESDGSLTAFHRTPGYETYQGLGWYGVIVQRA